MFDRDYVSASGILLTTKEERGTNMISNELDDMNIYDILGLSDIKKRPDILSEIKFDVTPQIMMEPRYQSRLEDLAKLQEIVGYMFYIETESEQPAVMLLRIGRSDITTTIGHIEEVPADMIKKAMDNPVDPLVCGMYAISNEIRDWLKKELGL